MKKSFLLTLLLFSSLSVNSEAFRVAKTSEAIIPDCFSSAKCQAGINDAISIQVPQDLTYISAIEVTVHIPEVIANFKNSVSYALYDSLTPEPQSGIMDYSGSQLTFDLLPGKLSQTIIIPLSEKNSFKSSPYALTLSKVPVLSKENRIFLRFMLSMKGVPESMYDALLDITVKPVLKEKGRAKINVTVPENLKENAYTIYIDDKISTEAPDTLFDLGEHHLSIISDAFRNEIRTFIIDQARTTTVNVTLKDVSPEVSFICPDNTLVYFDNVKVENKKNTMTIKPGEHKTRFIIGDYEIVKTIFAENGRTYCINLNVEVQVTENE